MLSFIAYCEPLRPEGVNVTFSTIKNLNNHYPSMTVATHTCNSGYTLMGPMNRTCVDSIEPDAGMWHPDTQPTCQSKHNIVNVSIVRPTQLIIQYGYWGTATSKPLYMYSGWEKTCTYKNIILFLLASEPCLKSFIIQEWCYIIYEKLHLRRSLCVMT